LTTPRTSSDDDAPVQNHAIAAEGVSKVFPDGTGVHHLDLVIPKGSIFGFIGPSGSGKTTTVRILTGVTAPDEGAIDVLGSEPAAFDARTRGRLGYMPQLSVLYPNLTVEQNLRFFSSLYGLSRSSGRERRRGALEFVELAEHAGKRVAEISGGMQRRLSLAAALVHSPDVIFLDEPTAGIDPVLRRRFWTHFEELRDRGRTLFVTTQYVTEAGYCDMVGVLSDGRLVHVDTPVGLRRAAYGGDIVDVEFVEPPRRETIDRMRPAVGATSTHPVSARRLRLVVDEAATAIPKLHTWLSDEGLEIRQVEQHVPDFDDVFVEIVEAHRTRAEESSRDAVSA
jgi:ABC-2 type transport system ATP-binding protein